MPKLMHTTSDIAGKDYTVFLAQACKTFAFFSLVWRQGLAKNHERQEIGQDLQPYQLKKRQGSCWPGTQLINGSETIVMYALNRDSMLVLARPGSVFSWISPKYPEDLAFYRRDDHCGFASVAHEGLAWILDMEFASALSSGLGFSVVAMPEKEYRMFDYVG